MAARQWLDRQRACRVLQRRGERGDEQQDAEVRVAADRVARAGDRIEHAQADRRAAGEERVGGRLRAGDELGRAHAVSGALHADVAGLGRFHIEPAGREECGVNVLERDAAGRRQPWRPCNARPRRRPRRSREPTNAVALRGQLALEQVVGERCRDVDRCDRLQAAPCRHAVDFEHERPGRHRVDRESGRRPHSRVRAPRRLAPRSARAADRVRPLRTRRPERSYESSLCRRHAASPPRHGRR